MGEGSGGTADPRPVLPWEELSKKTWKNQFIQSARTEPADKARRIAMNIYEGKKPSHGGGSKVMDMTAVTTDSHSKAIGKLLEKGEGYARIRLFAFVNIR